MQKLDPAALATPALPLAGGTLTGPLTLAADPASNLQAATKQYVDGLIANVGKRGRVRAATTANITIATALNNGDTLDGVTLATGDQVLVKNQTAPAENGVYVVGVTPVRAAEFDAYNEHPGSLLAVAEGTTNADTLWLCTSNDGGTLGTTSISFSAFSVTTPTFVGFSAYRATDQGSVVPGAWTKINFDTEEYDDGGYFNTANARFTPPAGKYTVKAGYMFSVNTVDQGALRIAIYKNGAVYKYGYEVNFSGTGTQGAYICVDIAASGTDYFEVIAYAGGAGDKTILGGAANSFFQANKIG